MKLFKYNFIARLIYRYANIPASLILIFYLLISIVGILNNWKFIFPLLINILLLYVLNKYYFKIYKTFPFKIECNNEKLICSDFLVNNREITIKHSDIENISGGIFSGRAYMPLYIETKNNKLGISPHVTDYNKLLTIILTNIPKELYERLLDSIKDVAINSPNKKRTKKSK